MDPLMLFGLPYHYLAIVLSIFIHLFRRETTTLWFVNPEYYNITVITEENPLIENVLYNLDKIDHAVYK